MMRYRLWIEGPASPQEEIVSRDDLGLLDLVERGLEIYGEVGAWAPATGQTWVGIGLDAEFEGASLAEAVKAALAELGE